eukprot:g22773.t1
MTFYQGPTTTFLTREQERERERKCLRSFDYCVICSGCNFGPFEKWGESLWFPTIHEAARQDRKLAKVATGCLGCTAGERLARDRRTLFRRSPASHPRGRSVDVDV